MSELPTTPMSVLRMLSPNESEINRFSILLVNMVKNGELNALELKAYLKAFEKVIEIVDKNTRQEQITEADKWSENRFHAYGIDIEKSELAVRYDYETSGDPVYMDAKQKLEERTAFLKALKAPLIVVDESTGEAVTIRPPLRKSTTGLKFHIK